MDSRANRMVQPLEVLYAATLLERAKDPVSAAREYRYFLQLWKDADPDLPQIAQARTALERLAR